MRKIVIAIFGRKKQRSDTKMEVKNIKRMGKGKKRKGTLLLSQYLKSLHFDTTKNVFFIFGSLYN